MLNCMRIQIWMVVISRNAKIGITKMNNNLLQLFSAYKSSDYYNQSSLEINLDWLQNKLDSDDLEELERQIYTILLENEEDIFIGALKYAWNLHLELSTDKK